MRPIKFRGKSINGGEWVESMTISYGTIKRKANCVFLEIAADNWKGVLPETVGQFTGLIEKNGKDIYEGDIIKYLDYDNNNLITLRNSVIKYYKGCFVYTLADGRKQLLGTTDIHDFEVIGNIYDNPELINESLCTN